MHADVLIIGAGHNGLVAGCYLSRDGFDVLVVEAANEIGGCTTTKPYVAEAPEHMISPCAADFAFIRGATVVDDLDLRRFGYADVEVDPPYVHLAPDGSSLAMWRDANRTAEEIRRFSVDDARAYLEYAEMLDAAMDIVIPYFRSHPTRLAANVVQAAVRSSRRPRRMARLVRLLSLPAAGAIERSFEHEMVRDLLTGCASFVTPFTQKGSGVDFMFPGFVHRLGIGRGVGGAGVLPAALERCLAHHGGRIRTDSPVAEISVSGGRATGLRLSTGETLSAPTVLASCDPSTTLSRLLPSGALGPRAAKRAAGIPTHNAGASHFKVDLAFKGRLTLPRHQSRRDDDVDLRVPTIISGGLEAMRAAQASAQAGLLPDPMPTCSLLPTAVDTTLAPVGQDTMYAWSGWMPADPREGWDAFKPRAADGLVAAIARMYDGIEELEIGRFVESRFDLAERTGVTDGQVWHVDLTLQRSGPLRPALGFGGYRTPVEGLFLTGGGTHPGPGVSGIPGQLAARTIQQSNRPRGGTRGHSDQRPERALDTVV